MTSTRHFALQAVCAIVEAQFAKAMLAMADIDDLAVAWLVHRGILVRDADGGLAVAALPGPPPPPPPPPERS